ncbi:hypothetical protein B0J17DRAFT_628060 [Rhizoctonia solani]|nr:hypothetical protein B0J17DRAFT_628060 [Rhizoctonia solani]
MQWRSGFGGASSTLDHHGADKFIMTTETSQIPRANEYVYKPPGMPEHLMATYNLKPIVGHPTDEDVKAIHAVIRAANVEAQVPRLYDPNLLQQLSQHLFSVQMALYRSKYPAHISPTESTYTPPFLPTHVSTDLDTVVGAPTTEQLKDAQHAMRVAESLVTSPLFDSDLNTQLSQHVFNLQFARYIQDSTLGQFAPKLQESQQPLQVPHMNSASARAISTTLDSFNPTSSKAPGVDVSQPLVPEPTYAGCQSTITSEITQQGKDMNDLKEILNNSKGVLENMNRVLIAIQRNQVTVGEWDHHNFVHVNPVNEQGVTAAECGLPQLRFSYHKGSYWNHLNPAGLAGYLKFFGIGTDLLESGESPRLKSSREQEARNLIFKHIDILRE